MERARKKTIKQTAALEDAPLMEAVSTGTSPSVAPRRKSPATKKVDESKMVEAAEPSAAETEEATSAGPALPSTASPKTTASPKRTASPKTTGSSKPKASTKTKASPRMTEAKTLAASNPEQKTGEPDTGESKAIRRGRPAKTAGVAPKVSNRASAPKTSRAAATKASSPAPRAAVAAAAKPAAAKTKPPLSKAKAPTTKGAMPKAKPAAAVSKPTSRGVEPLEAGAEIKLGFLAESVGFHLRLAQDASYRAFARHRDKDLIKPGRLPALAIIHLNSGISQSALGRAIARDKSTVSPLIKDLQKNGFISRKASTADRRSVTLALTKKGERTLERLQVRAQEHENEVDKIIGTAKSRLLSMLGKITTGMAP